MTRKLIYPMLLLMMFAGCASAVSASRPEEPAHPGFADLQAHPEQYQGQLVLLGGLVQSVQPKGQGSLLTVRQEPMDRHEEPIRGAPSGGTFLVQTNYRLNPDEYAPQREIDVTGVVVGRMGQRPLLEARNLYIWHNPYSLEVARPDFYNYEKNLKHWYTPPYFNPYMGSF
jgi:starvation-inducible outer membrane lipoprotein